MADEPRADAAEPEGTAAVTEQEPAAATETAEAPEEKKDGEEKKPEKLTQAVEMKDIGPCKKHIKVTVDRTAIDKRLDDKFSELVVDANVTGFRPGKAPRKLVERRYHKDVVDQVRAEVLLASLEQLAEEHDIAPLTAPNIDPGAIEIPREGPMVYEFDVEVRPQFDLPDYKGLKLRRPVKDITDADVEEEERRLLAPYGQLVPKEGEVQLGDYIIADITSRDGDRVISELKEIQVRVEKRVVFKDAVAERFGQELVGAKAGDQRRVDITLSEATSDANLRGKKVPATFDIKDVKTLRLPELTHDLLHEFGVHSPEQLRERIRVLLQWRLEYAQRQAAREQVLAQITAASEWQLPEDLLARQARKTLARRVMEMQEAGMSEDEIRARQRLLQQDALRSTELALKEHFVLQKIAEVEKIDVSDDDLSDEIERIAARSDESPRRVRARLEKEDMLDALAAEMIERKALDLILESAEYEDVPIGAAEEEGRVSSVEEQAVPGEMADPVAEAQAQAAQETSSPETDTPPAEGGQAPVS
jgi:trigger factor